VTLHTQGRRGKLEKTVEVQTDDPAQPKMQLKIGGLVESLAGLEPQYHSFGPIPLGESRTIQARIVAKDPDKLKIESVAASDDKLAVKQVRDAQGAPALDVTLKAPKEPGPYRGTVTVTTNLEKPKVLTFTVTAQFSQDLVLEPTSVAFTSFDKKGTATPRKVGVRSLGGKAFKVVKVDDPDGVFDTKVEGTPGAWTVTLSPKANAAKTTGTLRIVTDRADQKTLDLRWSTSAPTRRAAGDPIAPADARRPPPSPSVRRTLQPGQAQ
jgi:hypothetical protein